MSIPTLLLLPLLLAPQHPTEDPSSSAAGNAQEPYAPTVAEASDEAAAALARIRVPEKHQIKLWAAEPDLANPVCLYVDH